MNSISIYIYGPSGRFGKSTMLREVFGANSGIIHCPNDSVVKLHDDGNLPHWDYTRAGPSVNNEEDAVDYHIYVSNAAPPDHFAFDYVFNVDTVSNQIVCRSLLESIYSAD
jgi:hypothetical protein